MSNEEREDLVLRVKAAYRPLMNTIIGLSVSGMLTLLGSAFYLGGVFGEIKEAREFKVETEPKVRALELDMVKVKTTLKIK